MAENIFQKIWKDPVWSKVISVAVIGIVTFIYTQLQNTGSLHAFIAFWNFQIKLWLVFAIFALLIALFIIILQRKHKKIEKLKIDKTETTSSIHDDKRARFSNIFGVDILHKDANGLANFTLIIPKLTLIASHNADGSSNTLPYITSDGKQNVRVDFPVPLTEVESMVDISASIASTTGYQPRISPDIDVITFINLSYCSLGGVSSKTSQLLNSSDNRFYEFSNDYGRSAVRDKIDNGIRYELSHKYDYAIILKVHPRQFPNRVHICIAGMETWGTRGACYYLANKWEELEAKVGSKEFGAVIEVERDLIQSAELKIFRVSS